MSNAIRRARLFSLVVLAAVVVLPGCGKPEGRGEIKGPAVPAVVVAQKQERQSSTVLPSPTGESQILFGDLHVHTTFSPDAFIMSVPLSGGTGLHPPSQACDFARYCSSLDFWSINDHAEGLTPRRWDETKKSVRECNAIAGGGGNPDMVTFLGWEWSQVSTDPNKHYGHKNVIFPDTEDAEVPARAIASPRERLAKSPVSRARQMMMSLRKHRQKGWYGQPRARSALCFIGRCEGRWPGKFT